MGGIRVRSPIRGAGPLSWRCSPAAALLVTMQPTPANYLDRPPLMTPPVLTSTLTDCVNHHFDQEVQFLAALVQKPSDNPPGDCAPHAAAAAQLIEAMGLRVERLLIMARPADLDAGEITDKGYVNQRKVLTGRAALVELLYADPVPDGVIVAEKLP